MKAKQRQTAKSLEAYSTCLRGQADMAKRAVSKLPSWFMIQKARKKKTKKAQRKAKQREREREFFMMGKNQEALK